MLAMYCVAIFPSEACTVGVSKIKIARIPSLQPAACIRVSQQSADACPETTGLGFLQHLGFPKNLEAISSGQTCAQNPTKGKLLRRHSWHNCMYFPSRLINYFDVHHIFKKSGRIQNHIYLMLETRVETTLHWLFLHFCIFQHFWDNYFQTCHGMTCFVFFGGIFLVSYQRLTWNEWILTTYGSLNSRQGVWASAKLIVGLSVHKPSEHCFNDVHPCQQTNFTEVVWTFTKKCSGVDCIVMV